LKRQEAGSVIISGAHFNPAVTAGAWAAGRLNAADVIPYWIVQVLGAIAAAAVLYLIASGREGFSLADGFAPMATAISAQASTMWSPALSPNS
jgi:glycerol uptake facilitator-like aquaporin